MPKSKNKRKNAGKKKKSANVAVAAAAAAAPEAAAPKVGPVKYIGQVRFSSLSSIGPWPILLNWS